MTTTLDSKPKADDPDVTQFPKRRLATFLAGQHGMNGMAAHSKLRVLAGKVALATQES
jgi:hypothetical protein